MNYLIPLLLIVALISPVAKAFFFSDQIYRSLEQLDLALEQGDISSDEYEELLEVVLKRSDGDLADSIVTGGELRNDRPQLKIDYHGNWSQKLDLNSAYSRYHNLAILSSRVALKVAGEQSSGKDLLIRSRSIEFSHSSGEVILGSYSLKLASGLTQGYSPFHAGLRERDDFVPSLWQPVKNRENGFLLRQRFWRMEMHLFASRLIGEQFGKTSLGAAIAIRQTKGELGFIVLQQRLSKFGGGRLNRTFLAPYFHGSWGDLELAGESSFGLRSASAHCYSLIFRRRDVRWEVRAFSYGRDYDNLHSGGFSYSDSESKEIESVGFEYRDRRSGRQGAAISLIFKGSKNIRVSPSVVRWRNRLDGRECVAGRAGVSVENPAGLDGSLAFRAIWENLDLLGNADRRSSFSLSSRSQLTGRLSLDTYLKLEQRISADRERHPLRSRIELQHSADRHTKFLLSLSYFDPDLQTASGNYFHLSTGAVMVSGEDLSLTVKLLSRYYFADRQLRNWEARIFLDGQAGKTF